MTPDPLTSQHPSPADVRKAARIARHWPLLSGLGALALVVALGLVVTIRGTQVLEVDAEWMEEVLEHRNVWWEVPSLVMNFVGGGWFGVFVVPVLTIAALLLFRRSWAAGYYAIAAALSAGLVQLLKHVFGRARPEDMLIASDFGSFPSGHVANAATIAVALGLLVPRLWVWIAGAAYVTLMVLSRTYLGAHWFTDTIGGLVLGGAIAVIVWVPFAHKLALERKASTR